MWPIFKNPTKKPAGFSLPEVIIYVALVVVLLVAVTGSLLSISRTAREIAAWQSLQAEGQAVMDRVTREIRAATSTDAASIFGTNPGRLSLASGGLSGTAVGNTVFATDSNNQLTLKIGTGATSTLTTKTKATNLVFRHIVSGSIDAVRVELTLQTKPSLPTRSLDFYGTAILRSSYND